MERSAPACQTSFGSSPDPENSRRGSDNRHAEERFWHSCHGNFRFALLKAAGNGEGGAANRFPRAGGKSAGLFEADDGAGQIRAETVGQDGPAIVQSHVERWRGIVDRGRGTERILDEVGAAVS